MSKKQISLPIADLQTSAYAQSLLNFVMKNGSVYLARTQKLNSEHVIVKNTSGHTLLLPLAEIAEIWAEQKLG